MSKTIRKSRLLVTPSPRIQGKTRQKTDISRLRLPIIVSSWAEIARCSSISGKQWPSFPLMVWQLLWRRNGIWRHRNVHVILLSSPLGKIVNGDVFIKATKTGPSEESQRWRQKGCDDQIRNQTGNHDQHCVTVPTAVSWPSLCLEFPTEDFRWAGFIQNTQGRWMEALTVQSRHHFYFPSSLAFNIKIEALTVRYSSCRLGQNIIKRICKQANSWLTKQNLLIQWFEALDRNFCQQCRLRDSKKMKFADEMALMFLMKSVLLTDWIRVKNVHFSQCTVLSLWQNTY